MRRSALLAATLATALSATPTLAVDVNDGQLSVHGDGQWAYQRSSGRNDFGEATPKGNYDTAMFDLVLTARPSPELVVSVQLGFEPEGAGLEWGFAEWRFSEWLRLRVGKVQQPFGNLNELRFAGTTRPLYHLPIAVYGPANVVGTAYLGAGATGQATSDGGWVLSYDLYGGAVKVGEAEPYAALTTRTDPGVTSPVTVEDQQVRDVVGGRLSLTTPGEITLRVSGYAGRLQHGEDAEGFHAVGISAYYRGEQLWISAEAFRSREEDSETALTTYASVGWMLTEHLQVAGQYEWAHTRFPGSPSSPLLRHHASTFGLGWWVNPGLVFKACWHELDGNRFAFPAEMSPTDLVAAPPRRTTSVLTVGTQFAF